MNKELKEMVLRVLKRTEEYQSFINLTNNIKDEEFKRNIIGYYNEIAVNKFGYSKELYAEFSDKFYRQLSLINVQEIYYFLNYVLVFHTTEFERVLKIVSSICDKAGIRKLGICMNNLTEREIEKQKFAFSYNYTKEDKNSDIIECIDSIIDIENKTIKECVDFKFDNEPFCDKCPSRYCLSPNKNEYMSRLQNKN